MSTPLIINLGRQFGSGGKAVALEIGRLLGISVYDNELIAKAAEASGLSSELFRQRDEKHMVFPSLFGNLRWGPPKDYIGEEELFNIQGKVIGDIAAHESAVVVGRCSDYILRDRGCTLDVFITSPLEDRIARVEARSGMTRAKAEELIRRMDHKRETYYNYFTFGNWGVASNYDLCVDSSILGIEKTAEFIVDFAKRRYGGK